MKSKFLSILLTGAFASLAYADFNPVPLTPGSYTFNIVVPADYLESLPACINVTAGSGTSKGDNTYYEQGLYARPGSVGANSGIPTHNTVFTNINNPSMKFIMPPVYYNVDNELMIDSIFTTGTLTLNTATTATNLAILCCGGGGSMTVNYTVTHSDSSVETGTLNLLDWFTGGATVAWGANGRIDQNGNYNNFNTSTVNDNPPYLYGSTIAVSGASPVVSVTFDYTTGGAHGNFYAVSANASGTWEPVPVSGFNVIGTVAASIPFPVTATMDQGTNLNHNDNLATFFESGYVRDEEGGLPPSGSAFTSVTQPSHTYQLGDYSTNNAILIDTNHQSANITPATAASYSALAFLTAGGNDGAGMTNLAIIQHQNGVNETNIFYGYDWFDNNHNGSIALKANGRVNLSGRSVNNVGNNYPYLFETYFTLADTTSPVTNILVLYQSAPNTSSTTYVMAISASTGVVPPVVSAGPFPSPQTLLPSESASFTVEVSGSGTITGHWEVEKDGTYYPLTDGLDANGSTIFGSQTFMLTITNLALADGTNYQFVASSEYGSGTSPAGVLIVTPQTVAIAPATPVFYTGNDIPFKATVGPGPALNLQWFYIDPANPGVTNLISGATNSTYTVAAVPLSANGFIYGVAAYNSYNTNIAIAVLNISDSAAFLASDLVPLGGQAYSGAPVTYVVDARGNSPISYQWILNGAVVNGANSNSFTFPADCGPSTLQVAFSNVLNNGVSIVSSQATIQGTGNPTGLSFNTSGIGWQTNGSIATIINNVLTLTDGTTGGQASSAFFTNAIYVGGDWTASYIYNSHGGAADGTAFILQNFTNAFALGGSGGQLGYGGLTNNSLAFIINLYNGNSQTPGIGLTQDGVTGGSSYQSAAPVSTTSTNDILVTLHYADGVLTATLKDTITLATYTTNYSVGPLAPILGANVAYVGFSGGDGGAQAFQTVRDFAFHTVLPPVALSVSPVSAGSFVISWPAIDPAYQLQMSPSLSAPAWAPGPAPVQVGGTNQVTINVANTEGPKFYRLIRVGCQ